MTLVILADILLFGIICFCQDLQLLKMAIIHRHSLIENVPDRGVSKWLPQSQLTLAITCRTYLTLSWDAQKNIPTGWCFYNNCWVTQIWKRQLVSDHLVCAYTLNLHLCICVWNNQACMKQVYTMLSCILIG